jgi:hypothetical protein
LPEVAFCIVNASAYEPACVAACVCRVQKFAESLLEVADNLESAAKAVPREVLQEGADVPADTALKYLRALLEGVQATERVLLKVGRLCRSQQLRLMLRLRVLHIGTTRCAGSPQDGWGSTGLPLSPARRYTLCLTCEFWSRLTWCSGAPDGHASGCAGARQACCKLCRGQQ